MICLAVWICCVEFDPASPEEIEEGFLGYVSCDVRGTVMLRPMRVRLLHDGIIKIKVRRGGLDVEQGAAVSIDEETRRRVYELILGGPAVPRGHGGHRNGGGALVTVSDVLFTPAPDGAGLLGYVSCRVGELQLDSLALRRTRGGKLTVAFPCRRDRRGRRHPLVRPTGPGVEAAILAALAGEVL